MAMKNGFLSTLIRWTLAGLIIGGAFYYYINTIKRITKGDMPGKKKTIVVESTLFGPEEFFSEKFFYTVGSGDFQIDEKKRELHVIPEEDTFVSLSHQMELDEAETESLSLSFQYRYEKSGNTNPMREAGMVLILMSKTGYKNLYKTYPHCDGATGEWRTCSYTIERLGKPRFILLRLGGTSFYKKLSFRNIQVTRRIRKIEE